jgi:hypothetical protein
MYFKVTTLKVDASFSYCFQNKLLLIYSVFLQTPDQLFFESNDQIYYCTPWTSVSLIQEDPFLRGTEGNNIYPFQILFG